MIVDVSSAQDSRVILRLPEGKQQSSSLNAPSDSKAELQVEDQCWIE